MDGRTNWLGWATLLVAVLALAVATALLLRPLPEAPDDGRLAAQVLEEELSGLRGDIDELQELVEQSTGAGQPVDLGSLEARLDGLEASMRGMNETIATIAATAASICQLVADSPFTPGSTC